MSRIKYVLRAPAAVSESLIDGTPYWPDDDGLIETTNPNHITTLKMHGYTVVEEVTLRAPQRARVHGAIDIDDLGRSGLAEALAQRGVSYPETGSRHDLADIAASWNRAHAAPTPAPAPRAAPAPAPAAAAPAPAPQAAEAAEAPPPSPPAPQAQPQSSAHVEHDFTTYGYEDLKGWLSSRGVPFQGNAAKKVLVGLATEHYAKMKSAELEAV